MKRPNTYANLIKAINAFSKGKERAHDLIDLQLIMLHSSPDLADVRSKCVRLFDYRRKQPWPPKIVKGGGLGWNLRACPWHDSR